MPKTNGCVPSYKLHRPSGQARVILDGKHFYLGRFGSTDSHEKYARLIAERSHQGLPARTINTPSASALPEELTIRKVLQMYSEFAAEHYSRNGQATVELSWMKRALRPLRELFGGTPAAQFGPKNLKVLRTHLIGKSYCRTSINARVNRIRRFFKWAASEELVPPSVFEALRTVDGLRCGHAGVRESEPVKPVADDVISTTLPFISRQIAAMIRLQQLTGMRSGEVVIIRAADIDRTGDVWLYRPTEHKTQYRGHDRIVHLGPKAQEVLQPFLVKRPDEFVFSPADAEAERRGALRAARKTPMTPSQLKRKPKQRPRRGKRDRYDVASYRRAIDYGIKKAAKQDVVIPHWHPHQLRHSYATAVRRAFGIEAAQVALGHSTADVTQVYAERDLALATRVAREVG